MISATRFASAFSSFWRDATPTIDLFVRRVNLELYERVEPPAEYEVDPTRSALVAETAYALFDEFSRHGGNARNFFRDAIENSAAEARRRLALLNVEHIDRDLDAEELKAVNLLFRRLSSYFAARRRVEPIVRPVFPGCGFIDRSEADVIYNDTLFEVKAVARNFRSVDIKQLITYAALNHKSNSYFFSNVGVYNPRKGTEFVMELDGVCLEISGVSAIELMESIAYSVASGEISR